MPASASSAHQSDAALAVRRDQESRDQRADRRPGVAANLKDRLRQTVLAAGRHARDPRRLRVEYRRADADEVAASSSSGNVHAVESSSETDQRERHAGGQRQRRGPTVGDEPDNRLQYRGGEHQREGHHADLRKAQVERALEHGVD